jgi:hypothetical protein
MNERIKDLKEQALIWAVETLDPDVLNDNEWGVAIDDKFAELIVRECGQWIVDNAGSMEHLGPEYFARAMIKDFGVEE